jgi:hypothetical protein
MDGDNTMGLVEISALVAILAASTYILGLISLCWPVYRRITKDPPVAIYAVSLVPRAVIASEGVRIFVGLPLIVSVSAVGMYWMWQVEHNIVANVHHTSMTTGVLTFIGVIIAGLLLVGFIGGPIIASIRFFVPAVTSDGWVVFVASWVLGVAAFYFSMPSLEAGMKIREGAFLPQVADWQAILTGAAILFGLNFIGNLVRAFLSDPPLPHVNVHGKATKSGNLLTHSDGFWYLLTKEGVLVAISDTDVDHVRVCRADYADGGNNESADEQQSGTPNQPGGAERDPLRRR